MNNYYIRNADEYNRVIRLIQAGLRTRELVRIISTQQARQLVAAMGYKSTFGSTYMLSQLAVYLVNENRHNDLPAEPVIEPPADKPIQDDVSAPACSGANCGGMSAKGQTLRWAKADRGEAVTYSVDSKNMALIQRQVPSFNLDNIESWFAGWAALCNIKFKFVDFEKTRQKGDIHVRFATIDGPGRVLGITYMPRNGEFMERGGDLSGDVTVDSGDRWRSEDDLDMTGDHEIGHAIGLGHSEDRRDILYPQPTRLGRRPHGPGDRRIALIKYPYPTEIPA